jgi:hypothetical protein
MNKRTPHFDFKGLQDWVPIFRAGTQKDSLGREKVWTTGDLDQVVANHSADHPAPHVITHKELYSPFAYGRTAELKRDGDLLLAKSRDIEPQFEQLIKDGRLYERSVRLIPSATGWKLGHIAWLGAEPPAIAGLAPVQFNAEPTACDYSMEWRATSTLARMMRRMREFLIAKFGTEEADRVMPEWDVEDLSNMAAEQRAEEITEESPIAPSFSAPPTQHGDAVMPHSDEDLQRARDEARAQAQAEFSAQQTDLQRQLNQERESRLRTEFNASITESIDAGRLTPAQAEGTVEFMLQLSREPAEFEFSVGEGDKATKVKKQPLDWFREFMGRLPKQVDVGGVHGGDDASASHAEFSAPQGHTVDGDQLALHHKALDYQKAHPGTDYLAAVTAVSKE